MSFIKTYSKEVEKEIIQVRRHLHQFPELSNQEVATSSFIKEKLTDYGINYQAGFAVHGILGIIKGNIPGETVALRADMDALPIQEKNEFEYVSTHENIMHACGHDAHMAMLLGAGRILQRMKKDLHGTVLLVFQPAEEMPPEGGAKRMLEDGVFAEYKPDVIYGMHVWPSLAAGKIGIRDREMMGASDRFKIKIHGASAHASTPHLSNDAIVAAGHLITSLQTLVSRRLDPTEVSVLTIGKIHGGSAHNIITDTVQLEGTVRTYNRQIRERLKEQLFKVTKSTVQAYGCEAEIDYTKGYGATINTPKWAQLVRGSAHKLFGEDATPKLNAALAAEDFSRFLEKYPGAFIWLGTQIDDKENQSPLHSPTFKVNERALRKGSAFLSQIAMNTLNKLKNDD